MSLTRRALRRILPSIYASNNGALNHYRLFSCSPLVSPSSSLLRSSSSSLLSSPIIPSRSSIRSFSTANNNNNSPSLPSSIHRTACGLYVDRSLPRPFNKILIANRGEIACRIIRSCREIGVKAVAVYSAADRDSLHVKMADESCYIGDSPAKESYLIGERIIATAKKCGAQAIHPGYGFLSENAQFAKLCEDEGIIFIGPPPSAIESMGSKSASKHIMSAAGVPVIPGYHGDDQSIDRLRAEAEKVGYPLMIKAVSGGGGKGMRIVRSAAEFDEMLGSAQREAKNSFKDDRVLLERYITRPRHIEFQVFADKHGNAVHLFERDCSVQRRHQKVLEEAPAPGMTEALRNEMGTAAVNAAKAVGYVGAGTVEFIFDAEKNEYFFMEMNTRLQVEHPVTEMIMRKDLVQWQLHVAAGNKLPADQSQITSAHGHAIEARIYAENPYNQFLPCTGKLIHLQPPVKAENTQSGAASDITIRVESGVREGDQVSIFYDPMIAKLCVWGSDRISALHRLHKALEDYRIVGPPTNITFVKRCVLHPKFIAGGVETGFIAQNATELLKTDENPINSTQAAVAATLYLMLQQAANEGLSADPSDNYSLWNRSDRFRSIGHEKQFIRWQPVGEGEDPAATTNAPIHFHVERINRNGSTLSIHIINNNDTKSTTEVSPSYSVTGTLLSNGSMHCTINDSAHNVNIVLLSAASSPTASSAPQASEAHVFIDGRHHRLLLPVINFQRTAASGGGAVAPMSGKLVSVSVKAGDKVTRGTSLAIMEAMKMEHVIRASDDALVKEIYYQAGDFVEGGKLIISLQKQTK